MHFSILGFKTVCARCSYQAHSLKPGEFKMSKVMHFLRDNNLLRDESGATAIEYGLLAAGIAVAIIAAVLAVGTQLDETFESVSGGLN
jgi:pilus assembly protein Flp/PilA